MNRKVGVIFSYVLIIVEVCCSFFFSPLIINSLGTSAFGVYKLALSISSYATLLDLGIGQASIKYFTKFRLNENKRKQNEFFTISCLFYAVISLMIVFIAIFFSQRLVVVFANGLRPDEINLAGKLLKITFLTVAVNMGTAIFYNAILAHEMFAINKICAIIQIVLKTSLCVFVLLSGHGAYAVVLVELFATLIIRLAMAAIVYLKTDIRFSNTINTKLLKETLSFSAFVMIQMIALQITQVTDQIIIGITVAEASYFIAMYSVGSQLVGYFNSFSNAINGVIMPGVVKVAEMTPDTKSLEKEMIKVGRIVLISMGMVLCVFLSFGREFIGLWVGEEYYSAYIVGAILMIMWFLLAVLSVASQMLWAFDLHRHQALIAICVSILNIGLTVFMVRWNPLAGAAISTSVSLFLGNVIAVLIVLKRKIGINLNSYLRGLFSKIWLIIVITMILGLGIRTILVPDNWLILCVNCAVLCIIYMALMLFWGFNSYEKGLVMNIVRKKIK